MDTEVINYQILNLNFFVAVENTQEITDQLDHHSSMNEVGNFLSLLKQLFVGRTGAVMPIATSKILPINDYLITNFGNQLREAVIYEVNRMAGDGTLDGRIKNQNMIFDTPLINHFDIVTPTLLTQKMRISSKVEVYVLPVRFVSLDLSDSTALHIDYLLSDDQNLGNILSAIKSTDFFRNIHDLSRGTSSVTPIFGHDKADYTRKVLHKIRLLQGAVSA
jgi:hypothetical protein